MKRLLYGLGLSFCSLIIFFVTFEIIYRGLSRPMRHRSNDRPKSYFLPQSGSNLQDFRYSPHKSPNVFRISVVGDSFSFGPYLQFDDVFPKRVERWLNLNREQPKVEVINQGVCGYSTRDEVEQVKQALNADSDLVILQITLNDAEMRPYDLRDKELEEKYHFVQIDSSSGLLKYWRSMAFLLSRWQVYRSNRSYREYFHDLYSNPNSWLNFSSAILEIKSLCQSKNVKLLAVLFPLLNYQLDDSYPFIDLHTKIGELLAQNSIEKIDLFSSFKDLSPERLQVWPGKDTHPGEIAHRIAGEVIYRKLAHLHWVPDGAIANRIYRDRSSLKSKPTDKQRFQGVLRANRNI